METKVASRSTGGAGAGCTKVASRSTGRGSEGSVRGEGVAGGAAGADVRIAPQIRHVTSLLSFCQEQAAQTQRSRAVFCFHRRMASRARCSRLPESAVGRSGHILVGAEARLAARRIAGAPVALATSSQRNTRRSPSHWPPAWVRALVAAGGGDLAGSERNPRGLPAAVLRGFARSARRRCAGAPRASGRGPAARPPAPRSRSGPAHRGACSRHSGRGARRRPAQSCFS